jgi:hypothetical protein
MARLSGRVFNGPDDMLHASGSLDFPNMADETIAALTISCPGAAVGDIARASCRTALEAGAFVQNCRVSAADTVEITLGCCKAAGVNPAAATWDVVVVKGPTG